MDNNRCPTCGSLKAPRVTDGELHFVCPRDCGADKQRESERWLAWPAWWL